MGFFTRPQEKKKSVSQEQARADKRSMAAEKGSMFSFFKDKRRSEDSARQGVDGTDKKSADGAGKAAETPEEIKIPARERFGSASEVILRPHVTEKATDVAHKSNAYMFDVAPNASKQQIAAGIRELYGVDVIKVHTARKKAKRIRDRRGKKGMKSGGKKAYVYLKRGDTIEFV